MEQSIELESRHKNGIYAVKVLEIRRNNIIVKNPINPKTCILVPVSDSDYYGTGLYVDVAIANKGKSFKANLIGVTPPEFVPNDGEEIF